MSKETFKINSKKNLKDIMSSGKIKEKKKEPVITEVEPIITEQISVTSPEKKKGFLESKVKGAIAEIFRRKELDETVETNLSQGLESNPEFIAASKQIDKKRNWINSIYHKYINKQLESDEIVSFEEIEAVIADEKMESLEDENSEIAAEFNIESENTAKTDVNNLESKSSTFGEGFKTVKVKRSSGEIEDGWKLMSIEDGQATVMKKDNNSGELIKKIISESELSEINQEESSNESNFINPINEKVSKYAKSIGIKAESLATNQEFLNLSPEQQKFTLETLRRTSLSKATVEAHQTFAEEKAGKKWWQIGFVMNQNFHKERHKIEAIKNIESRGLEGYGETELAWLTEVIKNGPEIKVNDVGEVIVNCLSDSGFSDEQKKIIAKYNEEARNYIESSDKENQNYRDIKTELLENCTDEERDQLFYSLNESEKNIQLLKFLSANKETEEIIQKMASRSFTGFDKAKAMAGAQKDKAGYSALGFVLRTGSKFALANSAYVTSALTYSTAPLVAAMVGGLRGYNQGKKSLLENEELAQLGVTDKSATAKALNLAVGENSLKNKLDNLVDKLEKLRNEYASEEEIKKAEESLQARIYYTQGQMNNELVSYGSAEERGANYLELTNSLVRANSIFWKNTDLLINSEEAYYYTSEETKKLTRQTNLYKGIDLFNKIPDVSDPKYKEWTQDKKRFEELQKISIEDRLASFLNYKEDVQSRKELKFLLKKTATGAVMGASFAAVGSFVAEHLGLGNWLSSKFNSGRNVTEVGVVAKALTGKSNVEVPASETGTSSTSVVETTSINTHGPVKNIIEDSNVTTRIESRPIEEIKVPASKVEVSEIKIKTPDINQEAAPVQTPAAPIEVTPVANVVETPTTPIVPIEAVPAVTPVTNVVEVPVAQEVIDGKKAADILKNVINVNNNAAKIADGVYGNNVDFRTEEAFLKQVSEINGGAKLSPSEQLEAKNIFDSFKSNNDYNILRKRLISLEERVASAHTEVITTPETIGIQTPVETPVDIPTQTPVSNIVETNLVETPVIEKPYIADKIFIAEELHVKPEALEQVDSNLVYKGIGKSNIVFNLKASEIKEVLDVSGKKIPNEFIHDLVGGAKMEKFTRDGGLEKIFTSWNKISSNDKLIYESLNWFNKKTMSSEDLVKQIKSLYQVKTDDLFVDANNKRFMMSNGKTFDMTLKGVKKLIAYLPKN